MTNHPCQGLVEDLAKATKELEEAQKAVNAVSMQLQELSDGQDMKADLENQEQFPKEYEKLKAIKEKIHEINIALNKCKEENPNQNMTE